jgi:hypothetical protein
VRQAFSLGQLRLVPRNWARGQLCSRVVLYKILQVTYKFTREITQIKNIMYNNLQLKNARVQIIQSKLTTFYFLCVQEITK